MTALFPSTYTGRSVLNDMPPLTVVVVAAATSTEAASVPLALKTWIFPEVPIAGGPLNVIRSGGSGQTSVPFGGGKTALAPPGGAA